MKQTFIERVFHAYKSRRPLILAAPKGGTYSVGLSALTDILSLHESVTPGTWRALQERYQYNPAGLAVFCQRAIKLYEHPSTWGNLFKGAFEHNLPNTF